MPEPTDGIIEIQSAPVTPVRRVQTAYSTAMMVQKPRDLARVERTLVQEAMLMGEAAYYSWGRGDDYIEGPSVGLATAMARCWGNCAIEMAELQETADAWIFTAAFVDLETGFTLPRQFRQDKNWVVYGKHSEERKADIRFQIGQSKAVRNVILNALPKWLAAKGLDAALGGVKEKVVELIQAHGLEAIQARALASLAELGVQSDVVLFTMGRKSPAALTVEDLVLLRGNVDALRNRSATVDDLFKVPDAPAPTTSAGGSAADKVKAAAAGKATKTTPAPTAPKSEAPAAPKAADAPLTAPAPTTGQTTITAADIDAALGK